MKTNTTQINKAALLVSLSLGLQACAPGIPAAQAQAQDPQASAAEVFTAAKGSIAPSAEGIAALAQKPIRERFVNINVSSIQQAQENSQVRLNLFDDATLSLAIEKVERVSDSNVILNGRIEGDVESSVTLVLNNGVLVGNLTYGQYDETYEIRPVSGSLHAVRQVDTEQEIPCETHTSHDEAPEVKSRDGFELQAESEDSAPLAASPVIDVLVAYTPAAKAQQGGKAGMEAHIQMGVSDANQAFRDSGVKLQLRLAGMMEVKRNETGNFTGDLERLKGTRDGVWDEVHAERTRVGADQVSLIGSYGRSGGVAGIGYFNSRDNSAFTVTQASAFKFYTFAHEIGHNLGLDHSDGYVSGQGRFRTIMAYGTYPRIRRFSNPALTYKGVRTSDGRRNEAAIINRNAAKVAGFRAPRF